MPRLRGTELPQRSPKLGDSRGSQLRKSNSELDPLHQKSLTNRNFKSGVGRSPRGSQSDPVNKKRFGTRIEDLECQLEEAQEELRNLKDQLASAEEAKKQAQQELEKKAPTPDVPKVEELLENHPLPIEESNETDTSENENAKADQEETDVFEVLIEKAGMEPQLVISEPTEESELNIKLLNLSIKSEATPEPQQPIVNELALKNDEITLLKAKMGDKEKELDFVSQENESLKNQLHETSLQMSSSRFKEEELMLRLSQLDEELKTSQDKIVYTNEKLEAVEEAREALETEMKKLRVQTEQWKKAADAAASVLAEDVGMHGRGISKRCGSMDKHYCGAYEPPLGDYAGFVGSPSFDDDSDDGYGSGKRKVSGFKMLGDLWKKKSQK